MNKDDFIQIDLRDNEDNSIASIIRKSSILAIVKRNNYALIYVFNSDAAFRTAESYEDVLIRLFNQ